MRSRNSESRFDREREEKRVDVLFDILITLSYLRAPCVNPTWRLRPEAGRLRRIEVISSGTAVNLEFKLRISSNVAYARTKENGTSTSRPRSSSTYLRRRVIFLVSFDELEALRVLLLLNGNPTWSWVFFNSIWIKIQSWMLCTLRLEIATCNSVIFATTPARNTSDETRSRTERTVVAETRDDRDY